MDLKDKVVVVTGASSGIGEATAADLVKEGAKVVVTARREERLQKLKEKVNGTDDNFLIVPADISVKDEVYSMIDKAASQFGGIDVLVNNAGIMPLSLVKKLKVDEWMKMVDVNIKGVMYCVAAALPHMLKSKESHIINVSSVAGLKTFKGSSVYSATKFAVRAFSDGLRMELAKEDNVRVTCIEPGAVETELTNSITDEDILENFEKMLDMTMLKSEDISNAILNALKQPNHVSISEVLIMPREQNG